jgi:hypothetical protein
VQYTRFAKSSLGLDSLMTKNVKFKIMMKIKPYIQPSHHINFTFSTDGYSRVRRQNY